MRTDCFLSLCVRSLLHTERRIPLPSGLTPRARERPGACRRWLSLVASRPPVSLVIVLKSPQPGKINCTEWCPVQIFNGRLYGKRSIPQRIPRYAYHQRCGHVRSSSSHLLKPI
ncbi:hypothetical protein OH77DRAFT_916302 [Trametes cingulata]|nr:hypothetical protein OH77DRAFT_916302 [Trametes cingulata]